MNIIGQFIIFAFLSTAYFRSNQKASTKILFQLLFIMCIYDLLWVIVMAFVWNHSEDNKNPSIKFWASLKVMHTLVYLLAWVELALKFVIGFFVVQMNKHVNGDEFKFGNLFTLNYKEGMNISSFQTDSNRVGDLTTERKKDYGVYG